MKRIVAWFVNNPVAANLFMLILIVGGLLELPRIHKEEWPNMDPEAIRIKVPYRGASPEEAEEAVCMRIEEAIDGIDGIKHINATASEDLCSVNVELVTGYNKGKALDEITAAVNAIDTFPVETERPIITEVTNKTIVIEFVIAGDTDERALKELAESMRDDLTDIPGISQVEVLYTRPYEISVEVSEYQLRQYGLTLSRVADAIRDSSLDIPAGSVKTGAGEIMLRTKGQRYLGKEFEGIPVIARADGTVLHLADIAEIVDGFEETDQRARLDGKPAAMLRVKRTGKEDTLKIAETVKNYVATRQASLPEGIELTIWRDESMDLVNRLSVLSGNALSGLVLVVLTLTLFLQFRVAIWVAAGLPITVLGAIMVFPAVGLSISSLSLMGILLGLGILVDDAIVIGERIHAHELRAEDRLTAAIEGTCEVAVPVIFGVLTTMAAFIPIIMLPGEFGTFFSAVGVTVFTCLVFSVLESQLILPAHLAHRRTKKFGNNQFFARWSALQESFARALLRFAEGPFRNALEHTLSWRYLVLSLALSAIVIVIGVSASGRIKYQFFPPLSGNRLFATVILPEGTPVSKTLEAVAQIESAAYRLRQELDRSNPLPENQSNVEHILSSIGTGLVKGSIERNEPIGGSHFAEVGIVLVNARKRGGASSETLAARWRELTGPVHGAVELSFNSNSFNAGAAIDIQLRGPDLDVLGQAAAELRERVSQYHGVVDVTDSYRAGKQELTLRIRPEAELLGLSQRDLGTQVRQAFYGEEAQRVQRSREDVRVMVRYPESERLSLGNFEQMRIRTDQGTEVPSLSVAEARLESGSSSIQRVDRQTMLQVTANVRRQQITPEEVLKSLKLNALPQLLDKYPGISYRLTGEAESNQESVEGLGSLTVLAMLIIFALLAIPLHSYLQPVIIMSAIPFGMIGALLGHYLMGLDVMFFSLLGIVALSGVVVNASLVLVDYVNRQRRNGIELEQAVVNAAVRRFRPILLTSITTCVGLTPLLLTWEKATRVFVPMAVSLAFGVLFATIVTLILIPSLCVILEDWHRLRARLASSQPRDPLTNSSMN